MNRELADLRQNYEMGQLNREDLDSNPLAQFEQWMKKAKDYNILEPNAMTLSTISSDGYPNGRIVLLKEVSETGFVFFTNYDSQKAKDISSKPQVSLTFLWKKLERQVRIVGTANKISRDRTEAYFATRPHSSKLGAHASPQSSVILDRQILEDRKANLEKHYPEGTTIYAPDNWGGYEVTPVEIEFWQGRPSRLHDRFRYRRDESTADRWLIERLAP